jgi:hypothetical protein
MKYLGLVFFCFLSIPLLVNAQGKTVVLNGYVKDKKNGEVLINATVYVDNSLFITQTNNYGYYSINIPTGKHVVKVSFTGYKTFSKEINVTANQSLNTDLEQLDEQLDMVTVIGEKRITRTNTVALGVQQLTSAQIKSLPAFMGEPDILKAILTMPGVTSVGEGSSGFNVRGGDIDANLIILDEAPVFNSSHLMGFFSIFNPDAVRNVTLYKGAFPAEYGGRTSSVLDIRMKDGNDQKLEVNGGIGTVFSRLSVEGPLQKDRSSFVVAGRRSYIDVLAKPFLDKESKDSKFYFYDLTAKVNYELSDKSTLYLSGYFGKDVFGIGSEANFAWGNSTGTLRWNYLISPKLFLNTTVTYSDYDYQLSFKTADGTSEGYDWTSNIKTYGAKPTLTWYANAKHEFKAGFGFLRYDFQPGKGVMTTTNSKSEVIMHNRYGNEISVFAEDTWKITDKLTAQLGVRLNVYQYLTKNQIYHFRDTTPNVRKPLDYTEHVNKMTKANDWAFIEPRVSFKYQVKEDLILKAGYAKSSQYIHLLSNTASPTPVDLYFPSTNNIKPSYSHIVSAGVVKNTAKGIELSAEVFYKKMEDLLDFIDAANLQLNEQVEADLLTGEGKAYGLELEARKDRGKWQGWLNYTWSRSYRRTEGISMNEWYLSRFDRTHVLNFAVIRNFNKRVSASASFNYGTGVPATFADAMMYIQGIPVPYNTTGKRNTYRIPDYHRLDLSVTIKNNPAKKLRSEWVIGAYNVYARKNAYSIFFESNEDNPNVRQASQLSLLGSIIPSVTWNFKF